MPTSHDRSDRSYSWKEAPADILDGVWTYMVVPLEVGSGAPCVNEGGFRGSISETATAAICCNNACNKGPNVPTGATGWVEHPGTFSMNGLGDTGYCTFYETRLPAGEYNICCDSCWATGLFLAHPSTDHLTATTAGHTSTDECTGLSGDAKLSDAQINSVGLGKPKLFKMVSPGEASEPRATYWMRSANDFDDTAVGMGLIPVQWNDHDGTTGDWTKGPKACSKQRIDSECLYGNTCNRIFTDYSSTVGCYPATDGERCFNDGAPCGHQLIQVWGSNCAIN